MGRGWFAATVLAVVLTMAPRAHADDPVVQSCRLAASLADGTDAVIDQFQTMADSWRPTERARLDPVLRPELEQVRLMRGDVYIVADLSPFLREYLVVSADLNRLSTIVFRLMFQKGREGAYVFKNVNFNTDYYEVMKDPILQPPVRVPCPLTE